MAREKSLVRKVLENDAITAAKIRIANQKIERSAQKLQEDIKTSNFVQATIKDADKRIGQQAVEKLKSMGSLREGE